MQNKIILNDKGLITKFMVDGFFLEFNSLTGKFVNTDGSRNLSVDGTGILPSVDENAGSKILEFIKSLFEVENGSSLNMLDIGAGVGHLQRLADSDPFFNSYSFEGCSDLAKSFVCDMDRIAICDMGKPITDQRLEKSFNLTTSFEVLEHVHRNDMDAFFNNLKFVSNYHLCSIHCGNGTSHEHCTIQPPKEWEAYFERMNIPFIKFGNFPVEDGGNEFREFTGLHNWKFSASYLLKFN